jgi:capsular polysaccharide biosynthesis protein
MENNFEEIKLSELITMLAKKWWVLITSALLCIIISAIFTFFIADPVYQSDTSIYVGKELSVQSAIAYNDLILADRLVNDYRELVKSRLVTGMVIEKLGLNMTSGELAKKINVTSIKDTRLIQITAEDTYPERAKDIANTIAAVFREKVVEIMDVENVKVIDEAILPISPVRPNIKLNFAIALVLGVMIGIFVVFALEYFDKTIRTVEDVKNAIELPVIGVIPDFSEE